MTTARKALKIFVGGFVFGVGGSLTFFDKVGYFATVDGKSMQPVLNPVHEAKRDVIFLNHWAIRDYLVQRGDIVSLASPHRPDEVLIKRVIALEGDTIRGCMAAKVKVKLPYMQPWAIKHTVSHIIQQSTIDHRVLHEGFSRENPGMTLSYKNRYVTIPEGHCWLEGDHHSVSLDSNYFGPVALGLVHARASHIIWPLHRQRRLEPRLPKDRQPVGLSQSLLEELLDDFQEVEDDVQI